MNKWIPTRRTRNTQISRSSDETPARRAFLEEATERVSQAETAGAKKQRRAAIDAARSAANGAVNELAGLQRQGYKLPSTSDLVSTFGSGLTGAARTELRELLDEVRPSIESGSQGEAHEAARHWALAIGSEMAESGWARPHPQEQDEGADDPRELAARIPRSSSLVPPSRSRR